MGKIHIEVAYAGESAQWLIPLELELGSHLQDAIVQSGILQCLPELNSNLQMLKDRVGIFGEVKSLQTLLKEGDRVEIYRHLLIDPKEARKRRAAKAAKEKALQKKKMKTQVKK